MTPAELMKAILQAPVDLLWNGGIGTYVKSSDETHADAGDKANDAIRVDGRELRARCVGEGGNLGLTQLGRIEYAELRRGPAGRRHQHRLHRQLRRRRHLRPRGEHQDPARPGRRRRRPHREAAQPPAGRDDRRGRRRWCCATTTSRTSPSPTPPPTRRRCSTSTRTGCGPWRSAACSTASWRACRTSREVRRRIDRGEGLTAPELSVLLAWTKIVLADELIDSDLPDDPYCHVDLVGYFPTQLKRGLRVLDRQPPAAAGDHRHPGGQRPRQRCRHDVLAAARPARPGRRPEELTRANFVAREIFGSLPLREELQTYDNTLDAALPDPDAGRDAHPGRARVALAGQQPAASARQPGHGRLLPRAGAAADGRAAVAADGP